MRNAGDAVRVVTGGGRSTTSAGVGTQGRGSTGQLADQYWGTPTSVSGPRTTAVLPRAPLPVGQQPRLPRRWRRRLPPRQWRRWRRRLRRRRWRWRWWRRDDSSHVRRHAPSDRCWPGLDLNKSTSPISKGNALGAFNAAPYTQALGSINQAVTADQAASKPPPHQADAALRANYQNAYANAPVAAAPQAQQVGNALQAHCRWRRPTSPGCRPIQPGRPIRPSVVPNLLNVLAAADTSSPRRRGSIRWRWIRRPPVATSTLKPSVCVAGSTWPQAQAQNHVAAGRRRT